MGKALILPLLVILTTASFSQPADPGIPISLHQHFSALQDGQYPGSESPAHPDASATDVRQWQPYDGGTLMLQSVLGAAGGVVFAYAGWGIGSQKGGFSGLTDGLAAGYLMGSIVGVPAGTYLGGTMMGGDGALWATVVGGGVGCLLGAATLTISDENISTPLFIVSMLAPPILGYHLSAGTTPPLSPEAARMEVRRRATQPPAQSVRLGDAWQRNPTVPRPDLEMTVMRVRF